MKIRMTAAEYRALAHQRKHGKRRGKMNKLEARFAETLDSFGIKWKYEAMRLLASEAQGELGRSYYTPDFYVKRLSMARVEFLGDFPVLCPAHIEVKGYWREKDRLRVRMAAREWTEFHFYGVQWDKSRKAWVWESFS